MTIKNRLLALIKPRHTAYAMAGSYPDAPGRRMAWDGDGTVALYVEGINSAPPAGGFGGTAWSESDGAARVLGNNENPTGNYLEVILTSGQTGYLLHAAMFPEARDIDGFFLTYDRTSVDSITAWMWTSANTTNGIDGTWSDSLLTSFSTSFATDDYRDSIDLLSLSSVLSVKSNVQALNPSGGGSIRVRSIHIYGVIAAGETPVRLLFLDTANSDAVFTKVLDFGDVPRGQTTTRTFKLKNNSGSKTINTINIIAEDAYLNAAGWYTFGDDGVVYNASHDIGNLANGAEELVYLKQIIPDGETLGVQTARIKVSHASVT